MIPRLFIFYIWTKEYVMVVFNELRITDDKKCLIVDCEIEDTSMYRGMYIDSICVEYYKNVTEDGTPSDSAYVLYEKDELEAGKTGMRLMLKSSQLDKETFGTDTFDKGMFFVTVCCDGEPTPEAAAMMASCDCGTDNTVDVGVAVDWYSIYQYGIAYAAKLAYGCGDPCSQPIGFESFVLPWYALRLAIDTCNWILAKKLWEKFMKALIGAAGFTESGRSCGCR